MRLSFWRRTSRYSSVPESDDPEDANAPSQAVRKRDPRWWIFVSITTVLFFFSVVTFVLSFFPSSFVPLGQCGNPIVRREWRTLNHNERLAYTQAARCLTESPSMRRENTTIHDDFVLLHSRIGNYSHNAAPFLPWHRYFIHLYEQALHEHCNYTGVLPYWNWSLDWEDLSKSPVWDNETGFGGSGTGAESVANGHCVLDGPFAGAQAAYYEGNYHPHCLSRGFLPEEVIQRAGKIAVRPARLNRVFAEQDYYKFLLKVEQVSHLTIPYIVQGDFAKVTAPNDPVFFLHHGQVDRVWWIWQQRHHRDGKFLGGYDGISRNDSTVSAQLTDMLDFGDFAPDVSVNDVINTQAGILCYRYDDL
ncbi:conserved hypothetical protein [Paecilomyces variotii No. 5]|uniref:Tyrosinase copper-binding domain-containing protein n=1 Tax=Byssochlamys spectabilis (strain No. 5 / NBRC 109023) TaxID=1356009 RepID=V5FME0_BYSSN|nr:conserved hypothetical protein [Paecilomyces variotii No. 5]